MAQGNWLVVAKSREDLRLFGGDDGGTVNERSDDTTSGLDTEGRRSNVQDEGLI